MNPSIESKLKIEKKEKNFKNNLKIKMNPQIKK